MLITNYYKGANNNVTGIVFDTEKKVYKNFKLKESDWADVIGDFAYIKEKFKFPSEIDYYMKTKKELDEKVYELQSIGFLEDTSIDLDFGVITL